MQMQMQMQDAGRVESVCCQFVAERSNKLEANIPAQGSARPSPE